MKAKAIKVTRGVLGAVHFGAQLSVDVVKAVGDMACDRIAEFEGFTVSLIDNNVKASDIAVERAIKTQKHKEDLNDYIQDKLLKIEESKRKAVEVIRERISKNTPSDEEEVHSDYNVVSIDCNGAEIVNEYEATHQIIPAPAQ